MQAEASNRCERQFGGDGVSRGTHYIWCVGLIQDTRGSVLVKISTFSRMAVLRSEKSI